MVHTRHFDRRCSRMLQYQQTKNQELEKNMVAIAGQLKRLEEEAMKKLHVQEPYSTHRPTLPWPSTVSRTISASSEIAISPGTSPQLMKKSEDDEIDGKLNLSEGSVGTVGAVKPDTDVNYGKPTLNNVLHR